MEQPADERHKRTGRLIVVVSKKEKKISGWGTP